MHYHPTGKVEVDQPRIGFYFADKKPERNPGVIMMATNDVDIPAGAKGHTRADSFRLPVDFLVRDIWAHMHMIGRAVKVWAELPGGQIKPMLGIADWDFNWQDTYRCKEPFLLHKGTTVHSEWSWDNTADNIRNPSNPPRRITLGEASTDEMTGLIVGGVTANPKDEGWMWLSILGHYLEVERKGREAKAK